jgi:hypothetical protein
VSRTYRLPLSKVAAGKYVLDTQLFINAFPEPAAYEALQDCHRAFAPFEYLSVTENTRDFARIRRFVSFHFTKPWAMAWAS